MGNLSKCSLVAYVFLAASVDCNSSKSTPPSTPTPDIQVTVGSASWGYAERLTGKKVPGIDYGCVLYMTWNDNVAFAVWIDHNARTSASHETSKGTASFRGKLLTQEEKPLVDIACLTSDGVTGPLTINDQKLDLSGGWLVLVKNEGGKMQIKQLKPSAIPNPKGEFLPFKKLALEAEIADFFNGSRKSN